LFKHPLFTLDI